MSAEKKKRNRLNQKELLPEKRAGIPKEQEEGPAEDNRWERSRHMDENKLLEALKKEYMETQIPEEGVENMKKRMEQAKWEKAHIKRKKWLRRVGACAAAAVALTILLPNMNAGVAMAMEKIPVLGGIVRVVTFGRYSFEDENHNAQVEIPQVEIEGDTTQEEVTDNLNQDIEDYIQPILEEFQQSLGEEGNTGLTITYDVVTDTPEWFTLRINVLEVKASGYQYAEYYHIDKMTGQRAELKDLFRTDADYVTAISDNIKEQMREQMAADEGKIYYLDSADMPDSDFDAIAADQDFYFDESGQIVISFDEYEVAPGYMGAVTFTIPKEVTDPLRING